MINSADFENCIWLDYFTNSELLYNKCNNIHSKSNYHFDQNSIDKSNLYYSPIQDAASNDLPKLMKFYQNQNQIWWA